jgi:hypothetical protein
MIRFVAALSLVLLVAACGDDPTPAPPSVNSTTSTTSTSVDRPRTLAELAEDPCAVLSDADRLDLGVVATTTGGDPETCSWTAVNGGFVLFKPFPTSDETVRPAGTPVASHVDVGNGHTGVQLLQGTTCIVWVTTVAGQSSFRVSATSDDASIACPGATTFATVILANLA